MIVTMLALWVTLLVSGDTPIGRMLRFCMIEAPARRLNLVTRGQVIVALALAAVGGGLAWLLGGEGLRLIGMAAPEVAMWLTAFEVSVWVDALAAVALAASTMRFGAARAWLAAWRPQARRAPRARRPRRPTAPANDDEDGAPLRLAA